MLLILNIIKNRDINKELLILFSMNFVLQIMRYGLSDYSYTHIIFLVMQVVVILGYLIFFKKNNEKSHSMLNLIFLYTLLSILTFLSRQYIGFEIVNNISSLITDFTSVLILILYYNVIIKTTIKNKDLEILLIFYLYITLFFMMYAFVFQYDEVITLMTANHAYASSFSSFFTNRNQYGFFLFSFYSVYLFQSEFYKYKLTRKKYYVILILILISMVFTLSRTTMIGTTLLTFLSMGDIGIEKIKEDNYKIEVLLLYTLYFLLVLSLFFWLISNESITNFILNKVVRSSYKTTGRADIWIVGFENLKLNPLFGIGSFKAADTIDNATFHNTIIEILVRNGILGLILKTSILIKFLWYNLKNNVDTKHLKMYLISLFFVMQFETIFLLKINIRSILLLFVIFVFSRKIIIKEKYNVE